MKTPFTSEMFYKSGVYLFLEDPCGRWPFGTFLARFKHRGPVTMAEFKKELIRNHTVEDYLMALENPDYSKRRAPFQILSDKNPEWRNKLQMKWLNKQMGLIKERSLAGSDIMV
jgi:hypothetical protein